jgi:hypothetical protein
MDIDVRKTGDEPVHHHEEPHYVPHTRTSHVVSAFKRISWGAVFAGLFVSLLCMIILNMLGIAIGAGAIDPLHQANPFQGVGIGAAVWFLASIIISVFIGGWVAGRVAGMPRTPEGLIHGIVAYSTFIVVMFLTLTSATGSIVSGAGSVFGKTLSSSSTARTELNRAIEGITRSYNQPNQANNQNQANDQNANNQNYRSQSRVSADQAAHAVSVAAWWMFIGLILGGVAAAIGGKLGEPKPMVISSKTATTVPAEHVVEHR